METHLKRNSEERSANRRYTCIYMHVICLYPRGRPRGGPAPALIPEAQTDQMPAQPAQDREQQRVERPTQ